MASLDNKRINQKSKLDEMNRNVKVLVHNISVVMDDEKDYLDGQVEAINQNTRYVKLYIRIFV